MKKWKALLVALAVATVGLVAMPANANHGENNSWVTVFTVFCTGSHTNNDDPIVFPGQPGASHTHQFWGSKTTNANSTYNSMTGSATSCENNKDTAGYWTPALLTSSGAVVPPSQSWFYYYTRPQTSGVDAAIPAGLKMVVGAAQGYPPGNFFNNFKCNTTGVKYNRIVDCAGGVSTEIIFPDCVDLDANGQPILDSANHLSHMAYSTSGLCPASHPLKIPSLSFFANWSSVQNGDTGNYRLSSDSPTCATSGTPCGGTLHADFWNTWNQAALDRTTIACNKNHVDVPESARDGGCRRLVHPGVWSADTTSSPGSISNAGFESGLTSWTVESGTSAVAQGTTKNLGTQALKINAGTTVKGVYQQKPATAGSTYCVGANLKVESTLGNTGGARAEISWRNSTNGQVGGTNVIAVQHEGNNSGGATEQLWKKVYETVTAPTGATQVRVRMTTQAESDGVGAAYFDDVSFKTGACSVPSIP